MNLSPELKQSLLAALSEGGEAPGNQDAGQDYAQICSVIEEKLSPVFHMIGQDLQQLRQENDDLKDIVYKLITSFHDGVNGYKMNGIKSSVLPKFADDLGLYGTAAKDLYGVDLESELMNALMEGGDPDEVGGRVIGPYKERLGKYLGGAPAPGKEVSVEVETQPEPESEPETDQGELGLEDPKAEEKKPEAKSSASDQLFEKLKGLQRKTA